MAKKTPVYTQCQLLNHADESQFVILDEQKHWRGYGEPPKAVKNQYPGDFKHDADAVGSIGGVSYLLTDKLKWVIAWSNAKGQSNKVYTQILDPKIAVDWADIKTNLDKSSSQSSGNKNFGYSCDAKINDETNSTPNVQAKLTPAT